MHTPPHPELDGHSMHYSCMLVPDNGVLSYRAEPNTKSGVALDAFVLNSGNWS